MHEACCVLANIVCPRRLADVVCTPGMLHGFMRLTEAVGTARTAVADAGAWLRAVTR